MAEWVDPREAQAQKLVTEAKAAIAARNWRAADRAVNQLRFGHGWRYADMARAFGDEWEAIAQQLEALDGKESGSDE